MTKKLPFIVLSSALLMTIATAARAEIATHRAFYSLGLVSGTGGGAVTDVQGGMSFEWSDSCDGWTVEQRYVMVFQRTDGTDIEQSTNYVSWESKDGLEYRFSVKRTTNGSETEVISGRAHLEPNGGAGLARFDQPSRDSIALSAGTLFPTKHTLVLIDRASAGQKFDRSIVFDGSEVKAGAPVTTIILGKRKADPESIIENPLGPSPIWPLQLAFYPADQAAGRGEQLPDFKLSIDMQENGVVTGLTLGFEGIEVKGTLQRIEEIPPPIC